MSEIEERPGFPGALRRLGVWGPCRGPHVDRGAPRVSRGAPKVGGLGAMSGPPCRQRSAPGFPGRSERWGVWGALSGPPTSTDRGHLARVDLEPHALVHFEDLMRARGDPQQQRAVLGTHRVVPVLAQIGALHDAAR